MVGFCEIDPFCRAVLTKHYPDVPIYGDIKTLAHAGLEHGQSENGSGLAAKKTKRNENPVQPQRSNSPYDLDLLTASPPCQAASSAGRRKGTKDDRWLWPATFAVIARTRPRWVILENVRGLLSLEGGLVFDDLLSRMEKDGYEVWPFVAPAAGVGAPHKRERVWIVGHLANTGGQRSRTPEDGSHGNRKKKDARGQEPLDRPSRPCGDAPDAASAGPSKPGQAGKRELQTKGEEGLHSRPQLPSRSEWHQDWREVALATCHDRVDDGAPGRVYGPDRISEAAHRRERLKACGNAIVPQVAVEIMRAIDASGI